MRSSKAYRKMQSTHTHKRGKFLQNLGFIYTVLIAMETENESPIIQPVCQSKKNSDSSKNSSNCTGNEPWFLSIISSHTKKNESTNIPGKSSKKETSNKHEPSNPDAATGKIGHSHWSSFSNCSITWNYLIAVGVVSGSGILMVGLWVRRRAGGGARRRDRLGEPHRRRLRVAWGAREGAVVLLRWRVVVIVEWLVFHFGG